MFSAETFDSCQGHPDQQSVYHYHQISDCVYGDTNFEFIGVALDGHPIYGPKNRGGVELTSDDLDECHGMILNRSGLYINVNWVKFVFNADVFQGGTCTTQRATSRTSSAASAVTRARDCAQVPPESDQNTTHNEKSE